jgi:hypothetical protein
MATGAVAVIIYAEPRLTQDIDLVIELKTEEARKIIEAFPPEEFYCPPEESLRVEIHRRIRGHFNIIHLETAFRADCYVMGDDPLHHWGMLNRKKVNFEGESIWVASPEYVILRKLEYFREGGSEKHLWDIAGILTISGDRIDFGQLLEKIKTYGLEQEWEKAQRLSQ